MTNIPAFAPGCYGSALSFEATAPICSVCQFRDMCEPLHKANLEALREACGVQKKVRKRQAAAPVAEAGLTVPKKTLELVGKFERAGLRVTEALKENRNPFEQPGMQFMKIAAHLLLRLSRPLKQADLCMALQTKLHWTKGTADSHARMALQALEYIGAVVMIDGSARLVRAE